MNDNTHITLSIGIATYNHDKFISRTIESILSQIVDFNYEIIICDDCSQDKTIEILKTYQQNYPDVIKVFIAEKNAGIINNALKIASNCSGKYMTWLDGDDYWTNENKLQIQVDFLEKNTQYYGCFHDALIESTVLKEAGENQQLKNQAHNEYKFYSQFNQYQKEFHGSDLVSRNIIPTASLVFRNGDFSDFFKSWINSPYSLNWLIHLYLIRNSKFYYFNETWSVYTDHAKGISKAIAQNIFKKENILILKKLLKDSYYKKYKIRIYTSLIKEYKQVLYHSSTYQGGLLFFIGNYFQLSKMQIRLYCLESIYFIGRFIKKK